ncbi:hypothetical protein HF086_003916 [Spodoptera exigua]|uniref:Uncharacterized protein n=1 Tax=Spodoptera exigua TaxID=7107 RepID=A0A922MSY1_SPOEX|nr:hypothetical protein HF086_003916 [Spodoptera exigua]
MDFENITLRRNKTVFTMNESLGSSFESTNSDYRARSLPDLSTVCNEEIEKLTQEIEQLKLKLMTANNEIDNLILENSTLKKYNKEQENTISQLKNLCSSPTTSSKKNSTTKKRGMRVHNMTTFTKQKLCLNKVISILSHQSVIITRQMALN